VTERLRKTADGIGKLEREGEDNPRAEDNR
jgi:hypothetical protein